MKLLDYVARLYQLLQLLSVTIASSMVVETPTSPLREIRNTCTPRELETEVPARQPVYFHAFTMFDDYIPLSTRGHSFRTFYRRFTKFAFDTRSFGLIHCCPRLRTRRHTKTWRGGTSLSFHARRSTRRDRGRDQERW